MLTEKLACECLPPESAGDAPFVWTIPNLTKSQSISSHTQVKAHVLYDWLCCCLFILLNKVWGFVCDLLTTHYAVIDSPLCRPVTSFLSRSWTPHHLYALQDSLVWLYLESNTAKVSTGFNWTLAWRETRKWTIYRGQAKMKSFAKHTWSFAHRFLIILLTIKKMWAADESRNDGVAAFKSAKERNNCLGLWLIISSTEADMAILWRHFVWVKAKAMFWPCGR